MTSLFLRPGDASAPVVLRGGPAPGQSVAGRRPFMVFTESTGRKKTMIQFAAQGLSAVLVTAALGMSLQPPAAGAPPSFGDKKTIWHGFDRYDFLMDEADLSIKPYQAAPDE